MKNKPFEEATKDDLIEVVSQIEKEDTRYDTKRTEKECIKCFYRDVKGGDDGDE